MAVSAEKLASEAKFLKKWSKGKAITRQVACEDPAQPNFWAAGSWMTKISTEVAEGLVAAGLATRLTPTLTQVGAALKMK